MGFVEFVGTNSTLWSVLPGILKFFLLVIASVLMLLSGEGGKAVKSRAWLYAIGAAIDRCILKYFEAKSYPCSTMHSVAKTA